MPSKDLNRFREHWLDEMNSAALYDMLAEREDDQKLKQVYRHMSTSERRHADYWANKMRDAGGTLPQHFTPSWRTRLFSWMARRFGTDMVLPSLSSLENLHANAYGKESDGAGIAPTERSHAHILRQLGKSGQGGMEGSKLAQLEGRHRSAGGNALRAAVLGANDGLVSNLSLVMGVAGAELASGQIVLTGAAGLLAGAISMALGEWVSVQSSRELYQKQIRTEKEEIEAMPDEEREELSLIYQSRGLSEAQAQTLATQIMANKETALETLVRDELGVDPGELGGSAWEAAITSFILFAVGAIIPLFPFFFLHGLTAVGTSAAASSVGLFLIGAAITLFTGRNVLNSGFRQVLFGLAAAAATFAIGRLIGVSIAG